MYLGNTQLESLNFFFGFDGDRLELVPYPNEVEKVQKLCDRYLDHSKGSFLGYNVPISFKYLELNPENASDKLIFFPRARYFDPFFSPQPKLRIEAGAYFSIARGFSVTGIRFKSRYLSKCLDTRTAIVEKFSPDFKSIAVRTVEIEPIKCDFDYMGKRINASLRYGSTLSFKAGEPPLSVESLLEFELDNPDDDYSLLLGLINVAKRFLRFCLQVSDAEFDSIQLTGKRCSGKNDFDDSIAAKCGEAVMRHSSWDSDFRPRLQIPLGIINGFEEALFRDLPQRETRLTLRHLPQAGMAHHWDEARIILLAASFDFEFSRLYPRGIHHAEGELKARETVLSTLRALLDNEPHGARLEKLVSRVRDYVKTSDAFSSRLVELYKDHKDLINSLSPTCHSKKEYVDFADRVNTLRNDLAHGSLNFIRNEDEFLDDVSLLERVVLATQLLNLELSDSEAQEILQRVLS